MNCKLFKFVKIKISKMIKQREYFVLLFKKFEYYNMVEFLFTKNCME